MPALTRDFERFDAMMTGNAVSVLTNPTLRRRACEALPPGILQQVAVEALALLQERAEREPWVAELIEEVAASIGFGGLRRWSRCCG